MSAQPHPEHTLVRRLGKGGNATVYEAVAGGRRVALKRLRPEVLQRRPQTRAQFEREYHTLAQLAHPNIVEVYGYGIDADGPYYTMELLDEGGLRDQLPMPWPRACAVLRDVAAALAMVHSRRLVHRDVSLHNVRLSAEGRAKLIDFGAMTQIGVPVDTIGTPAYMAPESVYRQALDPRTDLFALGALGYRLLCGEDAYRARRIDQLRDAWRSRPRPLCDRVPAIPAQLDELLRQLLSLNPEGRCRTAAEVYVRLSAIAELDDADEIAIARAYLTTPALVGREQVLATIRRALLQAAQPEGCVLLLEGPAGAGRSRVLDACILDGQLAGRLVLRTRGAAGATSPFALIAKLGAQLVEAQRASYPVSTRLQALLEHGGVRGPEASATSHDHGVIQQELIGWLLQAASYKPLLLVIDDLHLADLESAAVLARLAEMAPQHPLTLAVSAPSDSDALCARALRLIRERAHRLVLEPLTQAQTLALVRSLFDDVVNVQLAAKRIYDVARGNPRATVDLAEWLVAQRHVVHEGGRWLIPDTLSGLPLPSSIDDALRHRLSLLGRHALELAAAVAVAGDAALSASDYGMLLDEPDDAQVHAALDELVAAGVLTPHGDGYELAQAAYRGLLVALMRPDVLAVIHRRIAEVCLRREQIDWAIYHLFYGEARSHAVDLLLSRVRSGGSPSHILHGLEARVAWLRETLAYCRAAGRPAADVFALQNELVRRAEIKVSTVRDEIADLCARYRDLTGYSDWLALPDDMEPVARIHTAIRVATERHQRLPSEERIMAPREALPSLVDFVSLCLASATANSEIELLEQMPPLAPFAPLSDTIRLMALYIEAVEATIGGRADVASAKFIEVLTELESASGDELGATARRLERHAMIAIGMLNASLSRSIALDYADRLEALAAETKDPYARSTSLRVRHQYHLRRGNWRQAQHWRHELELDKLTDRSAVFNPSGIYALSWIYSTVGSVAGMRECLRQMQEYSAVSRGLRIWERYMLAEYDRLRGAGEQAVPQYQEILEGYAGRHGAWLYAAHGLLWCLEALGRLEEGKQVGERLLAQANAARLTAARGLILRPLALIEARLGNVGQAVAHLSENIAQCQATGMGGINLGVVYECRARVAILAGDSEAFETYAELCAKQYYAGGGNPDLTARFDALLHEARRADVVPSHWRCREVGSRILSHAHVELRDRLVDCPSAESRSMQALLAVIGAAHATGGYLYGMTDNGLQLLASHGCEPASPGLADLAARFSSAAIVGDEREDTATETTHTESQSTASDTARTANGWAGKTCEGLVPQVLLHPRHEAPVGVLLLKPGSEAPCPLSDELLEVVADVLSSAGDVRVAA